MNSLNSNLILLIPGGELAGQLPIKDFKFQSDSINTTITDVTYKWIAIFKFQSDSINTDALIHTAKVGSDFKFQSDSINT